MAQAVGSKNAGKHAGLWLLIGQPLLAGWVRVSQSGAESQGFGVLIVWRGGSLLSIARPLNHFPGGRFLFR